jgi:hypothetical protein
MLQSANWRTLLQTVSTCIGSDHRMNLTTTSATPVMLENKGSGNMRMIDWLSKVLTIHMKNSIDGWHQLCVLVLSYKSQQCQLLQPKYFRSGSKGLEGEWRRLKW